MIVDDYWVPTAENINKLPMPLRDYIHNIETKCDPAGDIRTIAELRMHVDALAKSNVESAAPVRAETREACARIADLECIRWKRCGDPCPPGARCPACTIAAAIRAGKG